jgi:RNA polymerase sigma-70 factor (ECF subfamily)
MPQTDEAAADDGIQRIDPGDFDWIVRHHQRKIYRVLLFLVKDADAAETLAQECFLRAYRKRGSFRGECGLATWLVRIAVNLAHDHRKSRRWAFWRRLTHTDRIDTMQVWDARPSPERAALDKELMAGVQSAVDGLPERQKTAFLLRFIEEMRLEEIAGVMGLETGTVKAHLSRAVKAVRIACGR